MRNQNLLIIQIMKPKAAMEPSFLQSAEEVNSSMQIGLISIFVQSMAYLSLRIHILRKIACVWQQ